MCVCVGWGTLCCESRRARTNVVGAELQCLLAAHNGTNNAGLLVLEKLKVPVAALLPLQASIAFAPPEHLRLAAGQNKMRIFGVVANL